MPGFAEVRFKGIRKDYFSVPGVPLSPGDPVIVEADRGEDLGIVTALGSIAERKCSASGGCSTPFPERKVLRRAEPREVERVPTLREDEHRVRRETRKLVRSHNLKMKVTEAEWQFDRNKLIIYFTAERRVDFRELVRDLARAFRTRIELRQIGVRDESALLGGVGRCGRSIRPRFPGAAGDSCAVSCTSTRPTSRPGADSPERGSPFGPPGGKSG